MRARSQEIAELTFEMVSDVEKHFDRAKQKKYGALCHGFPLIVRECGLAAALGYLAAKAGCDPDTPEGDSGKPERRLLDHYARALGVETSALLRQLAVSAELTEYQRLTRHVLLVAEWLKRYAEGVLKVDPTGASQEEEEQQDA